MRTSKFILLALAASTGLIGLCRADEAGDQDLGGGGEGAGLSIREQLAAAMDGGAGDPAPAPAPAAAAPSRDPAAAPAAPAAAPAQPQDGAANRDAQGRFAKAGEQGQNTNAEPTAAQPGAEPQQAAGTIRPPASWSAAAKADFANLPPHIQAEVAKREQDIETGKAQWDQKAQRFNRLDALLAPRQDRFRLAGISEETALQQLFAAQDFLERDPVAGLVHLARTSGVTLQHLAQAMGGQQPQPRAQLDPALQHLAQEVNTLKQAQQQQLQSAQQQGLSAAQREIDAFAADPANLYYPNVRDQMGVLIRTGQASDLKTAYTKAIWADDAIRPLLIRDQTQAAQAEQQRQQQERAAQARQASGSVVGSPVPGSSGPGDRPAPTLRGELERAFNAA